MGVGGGGGLGGVGGVVGVEGFSEVFLFCGRVPFFPLALRNRRPAVLFYDLQETKTGKERKGVFLKLNQNKKEKL